MVSNKLVLLTVTLSVHHKAQKKPMLKKTRAKKWLLLTCNLTAPFDVMDGKFSQNDLSNCESFFCDSICGICTTFPINNSCLCSIQSEAGRRSRGPDVYRRAKADDLYTRGGMAKHWKGCGKWLWPVHCGFSDGEERLEHINSFKHKLHVMAHLCRLLAFQHLQW